MDILKPELVLVEERCYRFFDSTSWFQNRNIGIYEEESYEPIYDSSEDICDSNIEVVPYTGGRYKHSFHIPRAFFQFIIGTKASTKKRLETETRTNILVPKIGQDGDIIIIGSDRRNIISARTRIDLLVETSRKKMPFTHFLSIPMTHENIIAGFKKFKSEVLNSTGKGARGVNESIFQADARLHLTLNIFKLLDDEERKIAAETLHACKEDVIEPFFKERGPINILIKGIECMNDDPAEVNVLYAIIIDEDGHLQNLFEQIADYFVERGLIEKQYKRLKPHMTIMNTKFGIKEGENWTLENTKRPRTFDASNILRVHKNMVFGKMPLSTIHLSQRQVRKDAGYYKETTKIDF